MTDSFQAFLDSGASFEGKLCFSGTVRVDGHLRGEISSDGTLVVGETGVVEASLQLAGLIVHGTVSGDVRAEERVEVGATGEMEGNLETPSLKVEEGARVSAKVAVGRPPLAGKPPVPAGA